MVILQPAKVARPLAFEVAVVLVHEKPIDGLPVTLSTTESPLRPLPNASVTVTTGCVVNATPAVAGLDGCVENVAVATAAALMVIELLVAVIAPSVAVSVRLPAVLILQPANVARPLAFEVTVVLVHEKPTAGLPVTDNVTDSGVVTGCRSRP